MCKLHVCAEKLNDVKGYLDLCGYDYSVERNWEIDESWGIEYIVSIEGAYGSVVAGVMMACGL